jgi:hypothetical protein
VCRACALHHELHPGLSYYGRQFPRVRTFAWSVNPPPHTTAEPRMNIYGASQSIFAARSEQQLASWLFLKWMSANRSSRRSGRAARAISHPRQRRRDDEGIHGRESHYAKAFQFLFYDSGVESPLLVMMSAARRSPI